MGATLVDVILQPGLKYDTVVRPRVDRIRFRYPEADSTSGFAGVISCLGAAEVLRWKHPEKPSRLLEITNFLLEIGLEHESQLRSYLEKSANRRRFLKLRGIGPKSLDYLRLLLGDETIAVDRHMWRLLSLAGIATKSYDDAKAILVMAAHDLGTSAGEFDGMVWINFSKSTDSVETDEVIAVLIDLVRDSALNWTSKSGKPIMAHAGLDALRKNHQLGSDSRSRHDRRTEFSLSHVLSD